MAKLMLPKFSRLASNMVLSRANSPPRNRLCLPLMMLTMSRNS